MDIPELEYDVEHDDDVFHQLHGDQLYAEDEGTISETTEEEQSYDSSETCELSQEEDSLLESPTNLTVKDRLVEVAQVNYRDFFIKIFIDSINPIRHFFFEPIVQLDRKHIVIENYDLFQQDVLRFTVQMWNQELHFKVLERLRSMPELGGENIREGDIYVLPFEEINLVYKPGSFPESIQLVNRPIPYIDMGMPKFLHFYLLSNSSSAAVALADDFRRNPEFSLKKWQLNLVGRGLALGRKVALSDRPVFSYNISTVAPTQFAGAAFGVVPPIRAVLNQNEVGRMPGSKVVPVFSVKKCSNQLVTSTNSSGKVAFSIFNFATKIDHGYFRLLLGTFVVRTAGLYQFHFNGSVIVEPESHYARVELKVNGVAQATSRSATGSQPFALQPVTLTALLQVNSGESVEICVIGGEIYEDSGDVTHFEGILFAN